MIAKLLPSAAEIIQLHTGAPVQIQSSTPVGGGSINSAYKLQTTHGNYFLKHNSATRFPEMFQREAQGLQLLASSKTLRIPSVIGRGTAEGEDFLVLEFPDRGKTRENFWTDFGTKLAAMHNVTQQNFGLDYDNYMGSLTQKNSYAKDYHEFFIVNRLQPQVAMAGEVLRGVIPHFERLYKHLPELIPIEPPSLVHGDLWSGNFLVGPNGEACLIDPAVHFGHRETDIAMSKLFGGFHREFYDAYNEARPLQKDWEERVDLFNLYPLLVHVNLFGGGYVRSVQQIVKKFGR